MPQTICEEGVLLFWCNRNIIFVSFGMIIIFGDWPVESFLFPLDDMLEGRAHLERAIGDEAIFVSESPHGLLVNISAGESQIRKIFFDWSIRI